MAAKRSYKKRSYKKRRTIRKLKTTLRRKIQRGGNPAAVELAFVLFFALFGNTKVVELFIELLKVLFQFITIINQGGGNGKNFKQRGGEGEGEGKLSAALQKFSVAVQNDVNIPYDTKNKIDGCVHMLTSKEIVMPATNTPDAAAAAAAEQAITENIKEISQEQQGPAQENQATNNMFIETMKGKYNRLIDNVQTYFVSKLDRLDDNKQKCIKILLDAGFSIMKSKLLVMTPVEFMNAQAKAALENIRNSARNLLGRASQTETGQAVKDVAEKAGAALKERFGSRFGLGRP